MSPKTSAALLSLPLLLAVVFGIALGASASNVAAVVVASAGIVLISYALVRRVAKLAPVAELAPALLIALGLLLAAYTIAAVQASSIRSVVLSFAAVILIGAGVVSNIHRVKRGAAIN